ncbi:MAG: hypothetical protein ACT4OO_03520, partial [Nitrospiraceae bacterium]
MHLSFRTDFLAGPPQPLVLSIQQPVAPVFELYRRIIVPGRPSFLLESGSGNSAIARYSFLGSNPYMVLTGKQDRSEMWTPNRKTVIEHKPFEILAKLVLNSKIARPADIPPFFGGAVGYLSYDLVRSFEFIPTIAKDDLGLPDLEFAFVDLLAAVDHQTSTLHMMFCPPLERFL